MKRIIIALSLLIGFQAQAAKAKKFKVTIVNLTKGQPMTPALVAVHAPGFELFHLGQPASKGLQIQAQDGDTSKLTQELMKSKSVVRTAMGAGVFLPGQKQEIEVEANNPYFKISLTSMLARTNDAFAAVQNISTALKVGQKVIKLAKVYDAGAENNTEECAHIPAPPCDNPMSGTNGGEGFVRPHEGINGIGDLELGRDTFSNVVAKVIVERIQ
jgi:hypothetical protein